MNVFECGAQWDAFYDLQLHLSFEGSSAVAVSWVTWPQEDSRYEEVLNGRRSPDHDTESVEDFVKSGEFLVLLDRSRKMLPLHIGKGTKGPVEKSSNHCHHHHHHHHHHDDKDRHCNAIRGMGLDPAVQWGTVSGSLDHTETGYFKCYSTDSYNSGALHRAIIGDNSPLPASTRIFYRVGDKTKDVWSDEWSFMTPPRIGTSGLPYRLGLVGDLGQTEHSASTLKHLKESEVDSVVLAGDLSYADGYQPRWDSWGRLVTPETASQVWMFTEGNHEIETTEGSPDFLAFTNRFHMPYKASKSTSPLFYSYDVAGIHVLMLGSYADFGPESDQVTWLMEDLASVDRSRTPWVIAVFHTPWYNSNYNHQGEGEEMRLSLEPILYEHGVDAVVSGHVHAYERSHHVYDNHLDECGPIYINIGDGGNHEGLDFDYYKQPKWSAIRDPSYGHGVLEVFNTTHAHYTWYRNQDHKKEIADEIWLIRDPTCVDKNRLKFTSSLEKLHFIGIKEIKHVLKDLGSFLLSPFS